VTVLLVGLRTVRARAGAWGHFATGIVLLWLAGRTVAMATHPLAIDHHDAERTETAAILDSIRHAAFAEPPGSIVTIPNRRFKGYVLRNLHPGWAGVFVVFSPGHVAGRHIRFVGTEDDWALAQARGGLIAEVVERPSAATRPEPDPTEPPRPPRGDLPGVPSHREPVRPGRRDRRLR
jgi:hypothetical protein